MASTNVALNVADSIYLQGQRIRTRGANLTFESPWYLRMQIVNLFYWVLTHSFHRGKHLVRTRGRGKMSVQYSTRAILMFSSFFALPPKLLHNLVPNVSTLSWMVLFFYACKGVCAVHVCVGAIYVCWGGGKKTTSGVPLQMSSCFWDRISYWLWTCHVCLASWLWSPRDLPVSVSPRLRL